jgi:hypothetical protein
MVCDLILPIVSAPLAPPTRKQLTELRKRLKFLAKVAKRGAEMEREELETDAKSLKLSEEETDALEYVMVARGCFDFSELEAWLPLGTDEVSRFLRDVTRVWGKPPEETPRDVCWVEIDGRRIIAAGEQRWGGSPEGTGWETLDVLVCCNLLEVLGWR